MVSVARAFQEVLIIRYGNAGLGLFDSTDMTDFAGQVVEASLQVGRGGGGLKINEALTNTARNKTVILKLICFGISIDKKVSDWWVITSEEINPL